MKKEKEKRKVSLFAKPFYFLGNLFKEMYDSYTAAQRLFEKDKEAARKKAEKEIKENEKFYHDLEKTGIYLDDAMAASNDDLDRYMETESYKQYQPIYEKKLDDFIARNKKKLDGDELGVYLLICRTHLVTVKKAANYLHCEYSHAFYILESLCERLYISKIKVDGRNVYQLFDIKWYRQY